MDVIDYKKIAQAPVFFERNRVFRVYQGGKLFHDFFGDPAVDNNYPEEWIASDIKALNRDSSDIHEGISKIRGTDVYFDQLMKSEKELMLGERENLGILVKILDSAIRLPIQVHPDKEFSRQYFSSEYGKTETWIILDTRKNAHIYFGFKDEITNEEFMDSIKRSEQDKDAMESLLNVVPVKKGDVFLIPAKTVHAIGYGCEILEIQEPTDFTIQPEAWCGDYHLNEFEKYMGLSSEIAISCFDYSIYGKEAVALGRKIPKIYHKDAGVCSESIIGSKDTDCFSVNRHHISGGSFTNMVAPAVYIVVEGEGTIIKSGYSRHLKKGDYFFLPFSINNKCSIETDGLLEIIECLPPEK